MHSVVPDLATIRALAEAAVRSRECDGRVWGVHCHDWPEHKLRVFEVTHADAADPADKRDTFDVFEDPSESVARYVAALHPAVVLALLDRAGVH